MLKGQAKTNYQREYMRRRRADIKTSVRPPVRPKMGFEPKTRAPLDADGNVMPED